LLLLIEARRQGQGPPTWLYAAETLTTAAPTLMLDRRDVCSLGSKFGYLSDEPYFFGKWGVIDPSYENPAAGTKVQQTRRTSEHS
jgi:hypothetical protein